MVDTSEDVSEETLEKYKSLISEDIKSKDLGEGKTSVGLLTYGSNVKLWLPPKNGKSSSAVELVLNEMGRVNGKRDLKTLFEYLLSKVIGNTAVVEKASRNVVVLFTDGKSKNWSPQHQVYFKKKMQETRSDVVVINTNENSAAEVTALVKSQDKIDTDGGNSPSKTSDMINQAIVDAHGKFSSILLKIRLF